MAASTSRQTQLSKEDLFFLRKSYVLSQARRFSPCDYQNFVKEINSMSDYDFEQLISEIKYKALHPEEFSADVHAEANAVLNALEAFIDAYKSNRKPDTDDDGSKALWADICKTKPSDHIYLKRDDDAALCELWKKYCPKEVIAKEGIPSDLLFAGKIPLMDCRFTVDEREKPSGRICKFRVVIFDDYRERLKKSASGVTVGALIGDFFGKEVFFPIIAKNGSDLLYMGSYAMPGVSKTMLKFMPPLMSRQMLATFEYECLSSWYGTQIALLHPTVKDVFNHPTAEPVMETRPRKGGKKRRIVRYIKKHIITADELTQATQRPILSSGFIRHTPVWYVIGHWRHYSDGRKVFVKPYWKGEMRHLRMDLDGRKREIVIEEGGI